MICIITMYIRDTNMAYIHTLKYFLNMLFLVAALTESLFKCIILDVSPQFSNFIFFIHSIFKKYFVQNLSDEIFNFYVEKIFVYCMGMFS